MRSGSGERNAPKSLGPHWGPGLGFRVLVGQQPNAACLLLDHFQQAVAFIAQIVPVAPQVLDALGQVPAFVLPQAFKIAQFFTQKP